jgi:O-antigen/teichoic acid export membrane protein
MTEAQFNSETEESPQKSSLTLKQRAIRGSLWTLSGHASSQILRLGSNLILTRLLFPEAFGLMALVQTFIIGLEMFSDVGIRPSIIQNHRGNDANFLNTAWTIQVIRGFVLWLGACLLAIPAANFFNQPMLVYLLPVVGIGSAIAGFNSTKLATVNRHLDLSRLTMIELGSQILSITVMVIASWLTRSVWGLVLGGLVGAFCTMLLSHLAIPGPRNFFHWDSQCFEELHRFGRWVFISTLLTFLAGQGDRLLIARFLDVRFLGIYTVAISLSRVTAEVINMVGDRVLFPSYAELIRDRPERLYAVLRQSRLLLILISWAGSLFFIVFGKALINLLYDGRYADAGWILQTLALGALVARVGHTYDNVLLAKGHTMTISGLLATQTVIQISAMILGNHLAGPHGVVIGIAATGWLMYPFIAVCHARQSVWQPELDLPFIAVAIAIAALVIPQSVMSF